VFISEDIIDILNFKNLHLLIILSIVLSILYKIVALYNICIISCNSAIIATLLNNMYNAEFELFISEKIFQEIYSFSRAV